MGGVTGRLEVAQELLEILNLSNDVKITAVDLGLLKEEYFATRPASERLLDKKLDLRGLNIMRDWRICLREYIEDYYQDYITI